jgi:hypothetical protein
MSLFDRYQSIRQYHRPIDSPLYVGLNRSGTVGVDTANADSKLQRNSYQTEGSRAMNQPVRHDQKELLESLVAGKLPRNLSWGSVIDLIGHIGEVQPHGNDEFIFAVGSQRGFFRRPSEHNLAVEEISRLRRFLKEAGALATPANLSQIGRMAVVIDHHVAHIYHNLGDRRPQGEVTVKPYDPFGFQHHLIHRKEAHYRGDRVPEEGSYYEEIAADLVHAEAIILIGHGTGKSSAVGFLTEYLKAHRPEEFRRIVATETVDLSALTEPQIEEIAKRHIGAAINSA